MFMDEKSLQSYTNSTQNKNVLPQKMDASTSELGKDFRNNGRIVCITEIKNTTDEPGHVAYSKL